jgi:hypothetical protein
LGAAGPQLPPWRNPWLLGAIGLSMALHCAILYVPPLALLFSVTALGAAEWRAILWLSFPVILMDEALKYVTRCAPAARARAPACQVVAVARRPRCPRHAS